QIPSGVRVATALVAYVRYLRMAIWPAGLSVIYPYDLHLPLWHAAGAAVCLGAISLLVVRQARSLPYALLGWLWHVGTLVPVIGVVQVGSQALADRFTYVPLVGIFIILAWGGRDLVLRWRLRAQGIAVVTGGAVAAYALLAWNQVRLWQSSETLFAHAA